MKKLFTLLIILSFTLAGFAQSKIISGKVTDAAGVSLPGVTVQIAGTQNGTVTDLDGKYHLNAAGGVLRFSFIGFVSQDVKIADQSTINVVLAEQAQTLNEVVVVGYGTQKKKDLTTAVSVVGEKEIKARPIVSAAQALQGKAAGVQVTQPSGKPGVGLSVRVRGATSILAGNEPLYVIDGVPTQDASGLNTSDIASISILKDASASAIYGALGANGVVLITTKRGEANTSVVNFDTYFGFSKLRKTLDVLTTKDYRTLMGEIGVSYDPTWTNNTNWSDQVFGTGYDQSYQLSTSGGNEKMRYFVSGGYLSDQGIVKPALYDRYTVHVNIDNEIKPWLKVGTDINIINKKTKDTPDNASSGRGGVIMSTLNTPPFLQTYKSDGSGWFEPNPFQPSWENPVAYMEGAKQEAIDNRLLGGIYVSVLPVKDLTVKTRMSLDMTNHQWDYYLDPFRTNDGRNQNGVGQSDKSNSIIWTWENTADYVKTIGKHKLTLMVGNNLSKNTYTDSFLYGTDFPADPTVTSLNAANVISGTTDKQESSSVSFFGRATYDFNSKYYMTFSTRRDGSSKLEHRWGTMPAFSLGWRISSEDFMKNITVINDLKLRGGWGKTGNVNGLPNYTRYGLFSYTRQTPTNPLSGPASYLATDGNPDLKWETTSQSDIGVDLSLFQSRITLNVDVYLKETADEVLDVQLPSTLLVTRVQTNAGSVENKGLEFNLSTVNIDKEIKWTSDFNMSFNRNKIKTLDYTSVYFFGRIYSNNSDVAIVRAGLPIGSFYGYISEGVDPLTGNLKYKDVNGNGYLDPNDRTVIGNPNPKFTYGFTNTVSYGRWDLNVFLQGSYGNDIYNSTRIDLEGMFDSKNQSTAVLNRWTPTNTITDIPKAGNMDNVKNSTRFVEDGSYMRVKSATLSCKILKAKEFKGISKLTVYVTGQNLLTFTKYSGFDPEVNAFGNSATELGIDYGTYPQARTFIAGINVEF